MREDCARAVWGIALLREHYVSGGINAKLAAFGSEFINVIQSKVPQLNGLPTNVNTNNASLLGSNLEEIVDSKMIAAFQSEDFGNLSGFDYGIKSLIEQRFNQGYTTLIIQSRVEFDDVVHNINPRSSEPDYLQGRIVNIGGVDVFECFYYDSKLQASNSLQHAQRAFNYTIESGVQVILKTVDEANVLVISPEPDLLIFDNMPVDLLETRAKGLDTSASAYTEDGELFLAKFKGVKKSPEDGYD